MRQHRTVGPVLIIDGQPVLVDPLLARSRGRTVSRRSLRRRREREQRRQQR